MLDEPKANASTHGYATAGWVSAPAAGRVIARVAPMLGLLPDLDDAASIAQALYIPLQPERPSGARPAASAPVARAAPRPQVPRRSDPGIPDPVIPDPAPAATIRLPPVPALRDLRHEASYAVPADAGR